MPATVAELQAEIDAWIGSINPHRAPLGTVAKLLEELGELIATPSVHDPLEIADVLILALDLAYIQKIDVEAAIRAKLEINRRRSWRRADNGAMRHIPQTTPPPLP